MRGHFLDLTGERFGRLIAVSVAESGLHVRTKWRCQCDCGAETIVATGTLRGGLQRSCGCLKREVTGARNRTHGLSRVPEYHAINAARQRCRRPQDKRYADYGGRGIEYRLPEDLGAAVEAVISAIGPRPADMSLDRIDNDGHYELGNLRWASAEEQQLNQRRRKAVTA